MQIELSNEDQIRTVWFGLLEYETKIQRDLRSRYDNNPRYTVEDERFLANLLQLIRETKQTFHDQGINGIL